MQSAAKHLACGSNQNRCTDWVSAAREMLRCALHDRPLLYRYFGTSIKNNVVRRKPFYMCIALEKAATPSK